MSTHLTLLFVATWLLAGLTAVGQSAHKSRLEVPFGNPERKGMLKVLSPSVDAFTIRGYEGKTVIVEWSLSEAKSATGKAREPATKIALGTGVEAHEEDNVVTLKTSSLENLSIQVPRSTSLQLSSTRNGRILVENVDGEIEASGVDGAIDINGGSGPVMASIQNGKIVARFDFLPSTKLISLRSLDGTVELVLEKKAKASVTLECYEGRVNTDFEIGKLQHPALKSGSKLVGTINGGGAEIHLATHDGTINFRTNKAAMPNFPNTAKPTLKN
jgi:DUF4097 and DUF4098 domain-containing protein YvlB